MPTWQAVKDLPATAREIVIYLVESEWRGALHISAKCLYSWLGHGGFHEDNVARARRSRARRHSGLRRVLHLLLRATLIAPAMTMIRAILVTVIALSVAMLPAVGGASMAMKSVDMAPVSAADGMDCCPHKSIPSDKAVDDCCSMATCALKCFGFPGASFSEIVFPVFAASLNAFLGSNPSDAQTGSPPFRPPRV